MKTQTKIITYLIVILMLLQPLMVTIAYATEETETVTEVTQNNGILSITISDEALYRALRDKVGSISYSDTDQTIKIRNSDLEKVTTLDLKDSAISDLSGIENFTSLESLELSGNNLTEKSNLDKINALTKLKVLNLSRNQIKDVSDIARLLDTSINIDLQNQRLKVVDFIEKPDLLDTTEIILNLPQILFAYNNENCNNIKVEQLKVDGTAVAKENYSNYIEIKDQKVKFLLKTFAKYELELLVQDGSQINGTTCLITTFMISSEKVGIAFNDKNLYGTIKEKYENAFSKEPTDSEWNYNFGGNVSSALSKENEDKWSFNDDNLTIVASEEDLEKILGVDLSGKSIADLTGIEKFIALNRLNLSDNKIISIESLKNLNNNKKEADLLNTYIDELTILLDEYDKLDTTKKKEVKILEIQQILIKINNLSLDRNLIFKLLSNELKLLNEEIENAQSTFETMYLNKSKLNELINLDDTHNFEKQKYAVNQYNLITSEKIENYDKKLINILEKGLTKNELDILKGMSMYYIYTSDKDPDEYEYNQSVYYNYNKQTDSLSLLDSDKETIQENKIAIYNNIEKAIGLTNANIASIIKKINVRNSKIDCSETYKYYYSFWIRDYNDLIYKYYGKILNNYHEINEKLIKALEETTKYSELDYSELDMDDVKEVVKRLKGLTSEEILKFFNAETFTVLDISNNKLGNTSGLTDLSGVRELNFSNNFLTELDISKLKNIEKLNASGNNIIEVELNGELNNIEELNLSENYITNIDNITLKDMPKLQKLNIDRNNVENIENLLEGTNEIIQEFGYNKLADFISSGRGNEEVYFKILGQTIEKDLGYIYTNNVTVEYDLPLIFKQIYKLNSSNLLVNYSPDGKCQSINYVGGTYVLDTKNKNSEMEAKITMTCGAATNPTEYNSDESIFIVKYTVYEDATGKDENITVEGKPTDWTNKNVTLIVNTTNIELEDKPYSFDDGETWQASNIKEFTESAEVKIKVKDKTGKITAYTEPIAINIDKTAPEIKIESTLFDETTGKRKVTISIEEKGGSNLNDTDNKYEYYLSTSKEKETEGEWKTYTPGTVISIGEGLNGTYYLFVKSVKDNAGNESEQKEAIEIEFKDTSKKDENIIVEGEPTGWTNKNVTLIVNTTNIELEDKPYSFDDGETWQASNIKEFTESAEVKIKVKDKTGKITAYTKPIAINIDKTAPDIKIESTLLDETTGERKVTISIEEKGGSNLNDTDNKYEYYLSTRKDKETGGEWKTYTPGTAFSIGEGLDGTFYMIVKSVKDNAGNESKSKETIEFEFTSLDTTPPTIKNVKGIPDRWTNENITLTVEAEDAQSGIAYYSFDGGKNWQKSNAKKFTESAEVKIIVMDKSENIAQYKDTIKINIDKIAPLVNMKLNKTQDGSVEITITATDQESGLNSDNEYEYYVSTSKDKRTGGKWTTYKIGKTFTIGSDLEAGMYYIFIKNIKDNVGNTTYYDPTQIEINTEKEQKQILTLDSLTVIIRSYLAEDYSKLSKELLEYAGADGIFDISEVAKAIREYLLAE